MSSDEPGKAAFGFKIQGKARAKVLVNADEKQDDRQLITGVTGSVIQAAEPSAAERKQYVIPKLENTYKTGVGKFVPTFVPESSTAAVTGSAEDRYERAAATDQPALTSYGLHLREPVATHSTKPGGAEAANGAAAGAAGAGAGAILAARGRVDEAQQLKADLEELPGEATVEDYEALPVEEFGKALLRGLGWSDGQGVGRKRQIVEPKQTIRRPDRLGLGANPAAPPPDKRPRKMGDKPKQDLVAAPAADGTVRHRVGLDEQLVPRASVMPGPQVGKVMAVVAGPHAGLLCLVKEVLPTAQGSTGPGSVRVELQPSQEVVEVAADELGEKEQRKAATAAAAADSRPDRQHREQQRESSREQPGSRGDSVRDRGAEDRDRERSSRDKGRERDKVPERDLDRHRQPEHSRDRGRQDEQQHRSGSSMGRDKHYNGREAAGAADDRSRRRQQQQQERKAMPPSQLWLAPLIRVRVVDKRLQGGKLYLKKGAVLDVAPDGSCDIRMEDSRQVVTVHQDQLETVVPKEPGAAVMVVQGQHKGCKGRLLQVSLSSGAAALQLVGDMEVVRLLLDDVAQFMGHLEDEED